MKKTRERVWKLLPTTCMLLALSCGGNGSVEFKDIVSIPAGDKEGTALSGAYTVFVEITSDGCAQVAALKIPVSGTRTPVDITIDQKEGAITIQTIDDTTLRGGIDFDSRFDVGGSVILSRDGDDNILGMTQLSGSFDDKLSFTGNGLRRLLGRIGTEAVDCTYSFRVEGARQSS
jgi:hypothetical protein